jgi:carbon storage regulator CsrA
MLVVSRRPHEKIVFPGINASVAVTEIHPGRVRIGIEAPPGVAVFRQEVLDRLGTDDLARFQAPEAAGEAKLRELNHTIRNRLNAVALGAALLRQQIRAGVTQAGLEASVDKIEHELRTVHAQVDIISGMTEPLTRATRRRALVVEDDCNECELMAGFLRMAGIDVATAGDGAAALEYLYGHEPPDVVLLDMVLPRCDGPTTVRAIRGNAAYASVKVFGVTGHAPDQFGLSNGSAGVDRWFRKPLNPENLLRELNAESNHVVRHTCRA